MRVVASLAEAASLRVTGAQVSIGNFDGVHLGHRALISRAGQLARAAGGALVIVTFFPPARVYFGGGSYLSSAREKLLLLEELAPDLVVMIDFGEAFAATTADEFVTDLAALKPAGFVVGRDFRFGRGRAGGLEELSRAAPTQAVELIERGGERVASSRIRALLEGARLEEANELLGAPYLTLGRVVRGERRGREIGFPTANLELGTGKALPEGVFAVRVEYSGGTFGGMANVGARPTFPDSPPPPLEVHLFDFQREIYGEELTVRFISKLRTQRRFAGLNELKEQLSRDATEARAALVR